MPKFENLSQQQINLKPLWYEYRTSEFKKQQWNNRDASVLLRATVASLTTNIERDILVLDHMPG
jgi:hypothetical protein